MNIFDIFVAASFEYAVYLNLAATDPLTTRIIIAFFFVLRARRERDRAPSVGSSFSQKWQHDDAVAAAPSAVPSSSSQ